MLLLEPQEEKVNMDGKQLALVNDALVMLAGRHDNPDLTKDCKQISDAVFDNRQLTAKQEKLLILALQGYCMYVGPATWTKVLKVAAELDLMEQLMNSLLSWICYGEERKAHDPPAK